MLVTLGRTHVGTSSTACNKNDRFGCWDGRKNIDLGREEEKGSENAQMSVVEPTLERLEKWSCGHLALCVLFELPSSQFRLTNVSICCSLYHTTSCLSVALQHDLLDSRKRDQ